MKNVGWCVSIAVNAAALVLSACGGGMQGPSSSAMMMYSKAMASSSLSHAMPSTSPSPMAVPMAASAFAFTNTPLVANTAAGTADVLPPNTVAQGDSNLFVFPQTKNTSLDPHLAHAWGVSFGPGSAVWVNAYASNLSTLYDGNGTVIPPSVQPAVAIPPNAAGGAAGPTGIVANINTITCPNVAAATCAFGTGFAAGAGAAQFIFAGAGGTISAWAAGSTAITKFDGSASGDNFTGLAIYTQTTGSTYLLAADFHAGVVDVFDSNFKPNATAFAGGFHDPNLPAGYAPFGIQTLGALIYVSYAKQPASPQPASEPSVLGEGLGLVAVFDGTGTLMKELIPVGGPLNAPWGMALAPQGFGSLGGDLLIGNFGDGRINVFDPTTGAMLGTLTNAATGTPIHIPGLWGIAFGNGAFTQSPTALYYAAAPDMMSQGLYGSISSAAASPGSPAPPTVPPTPLPPPFY